jgi:hypothetical protein
MLRRVTLTLVTTRQREPEAEQSMVVTGQVPVVPQVLQMAAVQANRLSRKSWTVFWVWRFSCLRSKV